MVMPVVAIARGSGEVDHRDLLIEVLDKAKFWIAIEQAASGRERAGFRLFLKPDLSGFDAGSPLATSPILVEEFIDLLHDRGFTNVAVGSAPDAAEPWVANRDALALFDLMGYRFSTPKARSYEVVDLADELVDADFPPSSSLRATKLASAWLDADFRIVFSKCKTDELDGYSLGLGSVLDVLPERDKDLHYRRERDPGEVIGDVLALRPVHFALIDALVSACGAGGKRAPRAVATGTLIASPDIVLADYICALKMGIDPGVSRLFQSVTGTFPLQRYILDGDTGVFENWQNVSPLSRGGRRYREGNEYLDRLLEPWLQGLNVELFPLKRPLDATLNNAIAGFFNGSKPSPTAEVLLIALNLVAGFVGHALDSYHTLFDKDAIRRRTVNLGFDPGKYDTAIFDEIVCDLEELERLAISAPERAPDLKWRMIDRSVVFSFERVVEIEFDQFVTKVDVANVIQFMNDYMGGNVCVLERDGEGRPIRQAERNLYLPQPNYLALFHGKPIDVAKLECAKYSDKQRTLYWKTVESKNGSAVYDDGKASFTRTKEGWTAVSIVGKQLFELPLFWRVFDLDYFPELKDTLVTDAYQEFFARTVSNFEALVEGRDIRIGFSGERSPQSESDQLMALVERAVRVIEPLLSSIEISRGLDANRKQDADGFVHGTASDYLTRENEVGAPGGSPIPLSAFVAGLRQAVNRDWKIQ